MWLSLHIYPPPHQKKTCPALENRSKMKNNVYILESVVMPILNQMINWMSNGLSYFVAIRVGWLHDKCDQSINHYRWISVPFKLPLKFAIVFL